MQQELSRAQRKNALMIKTLQRSPGEYMKMCPVDPLFEQLDELSDEPSNERQNESENEQSNVLRFNKHGICVQRGQNLRVLAPQNEFVSDELMRRANVPEAEWAQDCARRGEVPETAPMELTPPPSTRADRRCTICREPGHTRRARTIPVE